ncbi:hypothetical protein, partial [Roseovarius spongiae]|uniref:hypothetical protein n=1 Tax=Roseovarius spongiae TaxID=2320272 RepID=UPI00197CEC56
QPTSPTRSLKSVEEASEQKYQGGHFWTPITPIQGSILHAGSHSSGFAALCDFYGALGQPIRNADPVGGALRAIRSLMGDQASPSLGRIGETRDLPASDMARCHGARVSELRARFHHAQ